MERYHSKILRVLLQKQEIELSDLSKIERLHLFKKTDLTTLPRVKEILGILKGLQYNVETICDFGSQRGALLFPLLENFPVIKFIGVDMDPEVTKLMKPLENNDSYQFQFHEADVTQKIKEINDKSVDMVIASEILEHLPEPQKCIEEAMRISKKYIIITVPSKPDNNPEHIQYFQIKDMVDLLKKSGVNQVNVHPNRNYNLFFCLC